MSGDLPDLQSETFTRDQVVTLATALGLDPNTTLRIRIEPDSITVETFDIDRRQSQTRLIRRMENENEE